MEPFTLFTIAYGGTGVIANSILIMAIILRTPTDMRFYSKILLVSAICDIICMLGMMSTVAKEVIVGNACLLELYGVCTRHSISLCALIFGVQEYMYTLTVCLLCLSFAFRYLAIDPDKKRRTNLFANVTIALVFVINSPMAPMYHHAIARDDPIIEKYRNTTGFPSLAVINYEDPFTLWLCAYTMMTSLVPFIACLRLRKMTMKVLKEHEKSMSAVLKQQHAMLVRALNIQLFASSEFLVGCIVFSINFTQKINSPSLDFIPDTTFLVIPICNIANVVTAICNLYVITPYRRFLVGNSSSIASKSVTSSADSMVPVA